MKLAHVIFLLTLVLPSLRASETISIERFKHIPDPDERAKLIEQAPRGQLIELRKIDAHLRALSSLGSEEDVKKAKESYLVKMRGLDGLEAVFQQQVVMWEFFRSGVLRAEKQSGKAQEQKAAEAKEFYEDWTSLGKRLDVVHVLVFNLAASPQALALDKNAETTLTEINALCASHAKSGVSPIAKSERIKVDRELDEIFELLKKLPTLPREEIQKQYDNLSDEAVVRKST